MEVRARETNDNRLDVSLNRRTKQKTENTVTLSHFYQNELDILEYNQSHSQCLHY